MQTIIDDLAKAVKRPITLEDAAGRLIAYSVHEQPVDVVRMETLLRKGASAVTLDALRQRGVYQSIDSTVGIARVTPIPEIGFAGRTCVAIRSGDRVLGYLWVVNGEHALPRSAEEALLRTRHILAQALVRKDSALVVRQEQRDQLVSDLCGRDQADSQVIEERARMLGWYPATPLQVLAVDPGDLGQAGAPYLLSELDDLCEQRSPSSLRGLFREGCVAILSGRDVDFCGDLAGTLVARLEEHNLPAAVGIGGPCKDLTGVRRSYMEASSAISLGTRLHKDSRCFDYTSLAPYELLSCLASCRRAGTYGRDAVEKVITYDGLRAGTLFETLEAHLDFYGRRKEAAAKLNIHPNTLDYRIRRVREITGLDLDDANTRLVVHIWVKALSGRVREASTYAP